MPAFVIFVEGADTEPAKVPVYVVESEEHASLICEGMKESEYQIFNFSFKHCTRSDRGKFSVWAKMIEDARKGVYGNIVGGIHDMIDGAYSIMGGRRSCEKITSGADSFMGGEELRDALGVHPTRAVAFEQQLGRKRKSLGNSNWFENTNPQPNAPKYFYRAGLQAIRDLAADYKAPKSN
jgi:hypothetical protein